MKHPPSRPNRHLPASHRIQLPHGPQPRRESPPIRPVKRRPRRRRLDLPPILRHQIRIQRLRPPRCRIHLPPNAITQRQPRTHLPRILRERRPVPHPNRNILLRPNRRLRRLPEHRPKRPDKRKKLVVRPRIIPRRQHPPVHPKLPLMRARRQRKMLHHVPLPLRIGYILPQIPAAINAAAQRVPAERIRHIHR